VNLATERATATAEPSLTVAQILGAVEAAGYDARLITDQSEEPAQQVGAVARGNRCGDDRRASPDCLAWVMAGGITATLIIGAVAGIFPALRAARVAPTEALAAT
jgi:hypothetical protein